MAGRLAGSVGLAGFAAVLATLVAATETAAQCALCGQGTRYAGTSPRQSILAFAAATVVLLVPTLTAAVSIGRTLWRHRDP